MDHCENESGNTIQGSKLIINFLLKRFTSDKRLVSHSGCIIDSIILSKIVISSILFFKYMKKRGISAQVPQELRLNLLFISILMFSFISRVSKFKKKLFLCSYIEYCHSLIITAFVSFLPSVLWCGYWRVKG